MNGFMRTLIVVASLSAFSTQAAVIDLTSAVIESLDGQDTLAVTEAHRTLTLVANQGVLNRTSSSFGINSPTGADDADGIDGDVGSEFIELFFSGPVEQLAFHLNGIGTHDIVAIVVGADVFRAYSSGLFSLSEREIESGEVIGLHHVFGNGFGLTAVHFQPVVARLTEPSHLGLVALVFFCLAHAWKLSRKGRRMRGFGRRWQTLNGRCVEPPFVTTRRRAQ